MINVCFGILMELISKRKVSASYLAEKFEVSPRSIYRYLDILSENGVSVFTTRGRYGGIQLADNYRLPATYLNKAELSEILSGLTLLKSTAPSTDIQPIIDKLLSINSATSAENLVLSNDKLFVDGGLIGDETLYLNKVLPMKTAIDSDIVVNIAYHDRGGEVTYRDIEPHAFVLKNSVWYVYAFCRLRQGFRMFKISRIEKLRLTAQQFTRREKTEFTPWKLDYEEAYPSINLLIHLREEARYDIEEWLGVECVKKNSDAVWKYSATASVKHDSSLLSRLMAFGNKIKILSPSFLIEQAIASAEQICKIYSI